MESGKTGKDASLEAIPKEKTVNLNVVSYEFNIIQTKFKTLNEVVSINCAESIANQFLLNKDSDKIQTKIFKNNLKKYKTTFVKLLTKSNLVKLTEDEKLTINRVLR